MSSFTRNLQRKRARSRPDYEATPQQTIIGKDGYATLHPTKGWRAFTNRRLAASVRMAQMLDHSPRPARKTPAKVWRKPAPLPPSVETRQQRRARLRGYRPEMAA